MNELRHLVTDGADIPDAEGVPAVNRCRGAPDGFIDVAQVDLDVS